MNTPSIGPARIAGRNLFISVLIVVHLFSFPATGVFVTGAVAQPLSSNRARQKAAALVRQAQLDYKNGRYKECQWKCRQAAYIDATYLRAYNWLGASSAKLKQNDAAIEAFLKVLKMVEGRQPTRENTADIAYAYNGLTKLNYGRVYVNGRLTTQSTPLFVDNQLVFLVPIRDVCQALGATYALNAATTTVTVKYRGTSVKLQRGSSWVEVNGKRIQFETPVQRRGGVLLMPLGVVEALYARTDWDDKQKRINVQVTPR